MKSVGVEVSKYVLTAPVVDRQYIAFWNTLINNLSKKNVKIMFLTPDSLGRKLYRNIVKGHWGTEKERLEYRTLVEDTQTRFMEKYAVKQKPDAIVCGAFHAALMRKDLSIPEKKFMMISGPKDFPYLTRKRFLLDIMELRRWQADRRKAKKQRLAEIRKRKERGAKEKKRKKRRG